MKLLLERLSADSNPPESCDEETRSPATSLFDNILARGIIPGSVGDDDPKRQLHSQEDVSVNPLTISQNDCDAATNASNVNRNYYPLACALLLLLLLLS